MSGKDYKLVYQWVPVYQNKYLLMGKTQIMVIKIFWDWATYWGVPTLLFTNHAFTNLPVVKALFVSAKGLGRQFGELGNRMQQLFLDWAEYETEIFEHRYIDPYDLQYMRDFQLGLDVQYEPEALLEKIAANMKILEQVASAIFRLVSAQVKGTPLDMKVDPYAIDLKEDITGKTIEIESPENIDPAIAKDVDLMWFLGLYLGDGYIHHRTDASGTYDSVEKQYLESVRLMHLEFVEPSKRYADLIVPEGAQNNVALDAVIARVQAMVAAQSVAPGLLATKA